ncbi:hypothetical protein VNO77_27072 [Canavalia gladiata]|uniref:Uncharacterized protein n=1 Tax=Canavalia gladiata TaxID=3824 RepID=A0AAN9KU44_CANGL
MRLNLRLFSFAKTSSSPANTLNSIRRSLLLYNCLKPRIKSHTPVESNPCVSTMAVPAPVFSTPFQPYIYQGPQEASVPSQILRGEAQVVWITSKPEGKIIAKPDPMCLMSRFIEIENA